MTDTIAPMVFEEEEKQALVQRLVDQAKAEGVDLIGPGGLLSGLTKQVLETALEEELAEYLGCDKHDPVVDAVLALVHLCQRPTLTLAGVARLLQLSDAEAKDRLDALGTGDSAPPLLQRSGRRSSTEQGHTRRGLGSKPTSRNTAGSRTGQSGTCSISTSSRPRRS